MRVSIAFILSVIGLVTAAPSAPLAERDQFVPCSTTGSNCLTQDQSFCDPSTGKISVCHQFGSDCWIRYTAEACPSKRDVEKRDKFDKCSVFGSNCAVDNNSFCDADTGHISVCQQVPFTDDCWIRYTSTAC